MLPSKELLSAVLKRKVKEEIGKVFINDCTLTFTYEVGDLRSDINIYELMHMMKEWAWKNNYQVYSGITAFRNVSTGKDDIEGFWFAAVKKKLYSQNLDNECYKMFLSQTEFETLNDTEFEAMTKVCEWILEQQNVSK